MLACQFVDRHAQQQDHQNAHGQRHGTGPKRVAGDEHGELCVGADQMWRQQPSAHRRHFRGDDRQQPNGSHLVDTVDLPGEHHVRDRDAADQREPSVEPPQRLRNVDRDRAPSRDAKRQKSIDDRGQPHGNAAEKHRDHRMAENAPRPIKEENPARRVEDGKQSKKADIEQP